MFKKTFSVLNVLAIAAYAHAGTAPVVAPAPVDSGVSYNNVSLGYQYGEVDIWSPPFESHGIRAGLEFQPTAEVPLYWAARGSWDRVGGEVDGADVEMDRYQLNLGVGYHAALSNKVDLVVEAGLHYVGQSDISVEGFGGLPAEDSDYGAYIMPHLRIKDGLFEGHLGLLYTCSDIADARKTVFARGFYEVAPNIDLVAAVTIGLEGASSSYNATGLQAGLRVKF